MRVRSTICGERRKTGGDAALTSNLKTAEVAAAAGHSCNNIVSTPGAIGRPASTLKKVT